MISQTDANITGFRALAHALDGWRTDAELRALDSRDRLGLTRQWHEGQRVFDPSEVAVLKQRIAQNDLTLPRPRKRK